MLTTVNHLVDEFATIRTGRANPSLVDKLSVEYYGTKTPLQQLATISVPDPKLLVIQPFDKSSLEEIEKSIMNADIGLNPTNDGEVIRIPIPPLSEERRKELIKILKNMTEKNKVSIRNIRREANEDLKKKLKEKKITEDENKNYEKSTQKLTDDHISTIDKITAEKEKEVLQL